MKISSFLCLSFENSPTQMALSTYHFSPNFKSLKVPDFFLRPTQQWQHPKWLTESEKLGRILDCCFCCLLSGRVGVEDRWRRAIQTISSKSADRAKIHGVVYQWSARKWISGEWLGKMLTLRRQWFILGGTGVGTGLRKIRQNFRAKLKKSWL